MTDTQPLPFLGLASTTLAPTDQTTFHPEPEISSTLVDNGDPASAAPPSTVVPACPHLDGPGGVGTEARPEPVVACARAQQGHVLRPRLLGLDIFSVMLTWVGLGFDLDRGSSALQRLAPGLVAAVVTLYGMRAVGLYRSRLCVRRSDELWRLVLAALWGSAAFEVVQTRVMPPGPEVLACAGSYVVVAFAVRWLFSRWLRARRAQGQYLRRVVLVGANDDASLLATMLRSEPELGYAVVGVIGECADRAVWDRLPWHPTVAHIPQLAQSTDASGVLVVPYALSRSVTQSAIASAAGAGLHVQVWPGFAGVDSRRLRQVPMSGEAFFYIEPSSAPSWKLATKRVLDVIGAIWLLVFTGPLIALSALLIKLEDGGPVLHRGQRVGLNGTVFTAYKLRSMTPGDDLAPSDLADLNERVDGPLFKASRDPRVTRVGRVLRAMSIDELPQFWNVLQGTMSLVGPRPALPSEVTQFDAELQRRHSVRPGVTGLWQIEARHNPSFNAYRRLDLRYVDNWSLSLDFSIIVATVPAVLSQAFRALRHTQRRSDETC